VSKVFTLTGPSPIADEPGMAHLAPTRATLWLALVLIPLFARISMTWGLGSALVLTPACAIVARTLALLVAPQRVRRAR
jgi:hypothetical protein